MKELTEQDFIHRAYSCAGYNDLLHGDMRKNMTEDEMLTFAKEAFFEYEKALKEIKRLKEIALDVLWKFAWYKDGTQYVGCGLKTYEQAKEELLELIE